MGDATAMSVRAGTRSLDGCAAEEAGLCRSIAWSLVRYASTVMAGARPCALFSICAASCECDGACFQAHVDELCGTYGSGLRKRGIVFETVGRQEDRIMALAWRGSLVQELLADVRCRRFLASCGLDVRGAGSLMAGISRRLRAYYRGKAQGMPRDARPGFPHEIGVVLGYPLDDVLGFIAGAPESCHGRWRCYGDAEEAQRRFKALEDVERDYLERFAAGASIRDLAPVPGAGD